MTRHFWLDKSNTIIRGLKYNTGLNPILKLNYGKDVTRGLIHFDTSEIGSLICDKTFSDTSKLSFHFKMTNCMSVDGLPYEKKLLNNNEFPTVRAASFDLILFELPQSFDAGRGFDYERDFWLKNNRSFTEDGCSWYFSNNGKVWQVDEDKIDLNDPELNWKTVIRDYNLQGGIYSMDNIKENVEKFNNGEESFVVGIQHFDFGDEKLDVDITDYILKVVSGEKENNGLCLAFAPEFEEMELDEQRYVGFFTEHTNTFFHPYIEAIYDDFIDDNRESFYCGRENRLYFYAVIGGDYKNLDETPTCIVDGEELEVKQATKGVYYVIVDYRDVNIARETIKYDVWSNLFINGADFGEVENEFVVKPREGHFKLGSDVKFDDVLVPSFIGIDDAERLKRGEIRRIDVDFRKRYETERQILISSGEYRIYIHDGNRDLDVFEWTRIEKGFLNNYFVINTNDLIPHEYFVDIRVNSGLETRYYRKALRFNVVSNVTERYQ